MITFNRNSACAAGSMTLLLGLLGCGNGTGHRSPILGPPDGMAQLAPSVTFTAPANNALDVAANTATVVASFSEPVAPLTGASFTVIAGTGPNPIGTVALDASGRNATFTVTGPGTLAAATSYTATITSATSLATGLAMTAPYVWHFTTLATLDTTRPTVAFTTPATTIPGPTLGAPGNAAIAATFSEDMSPAGITALSFTVSASAPGVAPTGTVSYSAASRTALFTPDAPLVAGTTYTASISTAARDLAGNALAGNQGPAPSAYAWSFTASAPVAAAGLSVLSTSPADQAIGVNPAATVNATFTTPAGFRLDPRTVNTGTFSLTETAPDRVAVPAASVELDATGRIASFTPLNPLIVGATYQAAIISGGNGVRDLAVPANALAGPAIWTFTVGAAVPGAAAAVALGSASSFGSFGGSAGTTNEGILTVVNGDIGTTAVSSLVTGFHDAGVGNTYTETPLNNGTVNGRIFTAPPAPTAGSTDEGTAATFAIATQARADALTAYNALVAMTAGGDPGSGNLANLVLVPGVYTSVSGSFLIRNGDLTLDARGDTNAVWVFQMANSLTVGGPGAAFPQSVLLVNGAQAKNVFWQVGSAATINAGGGGTMAGTIISQAGAAISTHDNVTLVTLNGRAISLGASVTLVNTIVNVPSN